MSLRSVIDSLVTQFSPDEARDYHGRWTAMGAFMGNARYEALSYHERAMFHRAAMGHLLLRIKEHPQQEDELYSELIRHRTASEHMKKLDSNYQTEEKSYDRSHKALAVFHEDNAGYYAEIHPDAENIRMREDHLRLAEQHRQLEANPHLYLPEVMSKEDWKRHYGPTLTAEQAKAHLADARNQGHFSAAQEQALKELVPVDHGDFNGHFEGDQFAGPAFYAGLTPYLKGRYHYAAHRYLSQQDEEDLAVQHANAGYKFTSIENKVKSAYPGDHQGLSEAYHLLGDLYDKQSKEHPEDKALAAARDEAHALAQMHTQLLGGHTPGNISSTAYRHAMNQTDWEAELEHRGVTIESAKELAAHYGLNGEFNPHEVLALEHLRMLPATVSDHLYDRLLPSSKDFTRVMDHPTVTSAIDNSARMMSLEKTFRAYNQHMTPDQEKTLQLLLEKQRTRRGITKDEQEHVATVLAPLIEDRKFLTPAELQLVEKIDHHTSATQSPWASQIEDPHSPGYDTLVRSARVKAEYGRDLSPQELAAVVSNNNNKDTVFHWAAGRVSEDPAKAQIQYGEVGWYYHQIAKNGRNHTKEEQVALREKSEHFHDKAAELEDVARRAEEEKRERTMALRAGDAIRAGETPYHPDFVMLQKYDPEAAQRGEQLFPEVGKERENYINTTPTADTIRAYRDAALEHQILGNEVEQSRYETMMRLEKPLVGKKGLDRAILLDRVNLQDVPNSLRYRLDDRYHKALSLAVDNLPTDERRTFWEGHVERAVEKTLPENVTIDAAHKPLSYQAEVALEKALRGDSSTISQGDWHSAMMMHHQQAEAALRRGDVRQAVIHGQIATTARERFVQEVSDTNTLARARERAFETAQQAVHDGSWSFTLPHLRGIAGVHLSPMIEEVKGDKGLAWAEGEIAKRQLDKSSGAFHSIDMLHRIMIEHLKSAPPWSPRISRYLHQTERDVEGATGVRREDAAFRLARAQGELAPPLGWYDREIARATGKPHETVASVLAQIEELQQLQAPSKAGQARIDRKIKLLEERKNKLEKLGSPDDLATLRQSRAQYQQYQTLKRDALRHALVADTHHQKLMAAIDRATKAKTDNARLGHLEAARMHGLQEHAHIAEATTANREANDLHDKIKIFPHGSGSTPVDPNVSYNSDHPLDSLRASDHPDDASVGTDYEISRMELRQFAAAWNSSGRSPEMAALLVAIEKELHVPIGKDARWTDKYLANTSNPEELLASARRTVRAVYAHTQRTLQDSGVFTNVRLWRGRYVTTKNETPEVKDIPKGGHIDTSYEYGGVRSWATTRNSAREFSGSTGANTPGREVARIIYAMDVDPSRIFAIGGLSHIGMSGEDEVLVLGGKYEVGATRYQ